MPATESTDVSSRTDALLRITQAIETAATLDDLLLLALQELTRLFDVEQGTILLLHDGERSAHVICEFPSHGPLPPPLLVAEAPLLRQVIEARQPIQAHREKDTSNLTDGLLHGGARSALLAPLVSQDRVIAVLVLRAVEAQRFFSDGELALLRMLAGQIAAAIAALRLNEKAQRRNQELVTLNEIATTVTSTLDTHEVYRLVVQKLNEYFMVDAGSILLIDEQSGDLQIVMTIEGGEEKLAGKIVPKGRGVVGYVTMTGKPEIVHDAQSDPRFYRKISEDVGYVTRSILCVPMIAKGRVIGAIELLNKLDGSFTDDDAERLTRMAAFIGVAIENARLFQQVADGRDRLEAILNSTADGIVMADMRGVVLSANPMAADLFQSPAEALLGCSLEELLGRLHASAREVVTRDWGNGDGSEDEGHMPSMAELELGGGRHRYVRQLALPVRDADGETYGQLVLFRDITQEKELEQLRDDWTGMLVHDLRAPLTSIMNGITMVQRGLGGPVTEQQRELLGIAYQGSNALLELVNNLLDISKMEQGRVPLDPEPLIPYTLIDTAIERLKNSASFQKVRIEQRLAVGLPPIEADEEKVVRVLQNLIDNAIKFSPNGGGVVLGAHRYEASASSPPDLPLRPPLEHGAWLVLWVQDHGPGIPMAYHERIFEKFGQVRGRKVRGTGLGLTFCKLAVEAHGGRIWLESDEGRGSIFAFALPLGGERGDDV